MCVLCGELITQIHWTDKLSGEDEQSTTIVGGASQRTRTRDHHHRVKILNEVLEFYGLNVRYWAGNRYMISDRKGNSVLCTNLSEVWTEAQNLAGQPVDPTDSRLVNHLSLIGDVKGNMG